MLQPTKNDLIVIPSLFFEPKQRHLKLNPISIITAFSFYICIFPSSSLSQKGFPPCPTHFSFQIFPSQIQYNVPLSLQWHSESPLVCSSSSSSFTSAMMVPELERPRITEIHVRIDCNGCVQKIKRALNGINGIYDFYIDIPQQKITIIGWADPEKIIKAIKRVRKLATICSQTEAPDPTSQPPQPPPDGGAPPPDGEPQGPGSRNAPPVEPQCSEAAPPPGPPLQEPPNHQPPPPPPQPRENPPDQNPPPETNPPPQATNVQPTQPPNEPRYDEEVHVIHHHPPDYSCRGGYGNRYGPRYSHSSSEPWGSHPGQSYRHEPPHQPVYHEPPTNIVYHEPLHPPVYHKPPPQPVYHEPPPHSVYSGPPPQPYVNHSYNRYRPSHNITEYQYVQSPPPYRAYSRTDHYYMDSYQNGSTSNGNVTSMFSDENPNACTIV